MAVAGTDGTRIFAAQRRSMVDGQIRTFGVTDADVIAAFLTVPRERFVPENQRSLAYSDAILTLAPHAEGGERRALFQPMHLARLIQGASIRAGDKVLVVGGGNGYAACLLATMAAEVVSLDTDETWAEEGARIAVDLGFEAVKMVTGPLPSGWPGEAPYDVILVQGAIETGLEPLLTQLAPEGRLVTVETRGREATRRTGKAVALRRTATDISARPLFDAIVPVLPEFRQPAGFVF